MKRVVLLPLHPAVTFNGVSRMTQLDAFRGLVFSAREKNEMNISCAALELLTHAKFKSQMTQLPCHELQVMSVLCTIYSCAHSHFDFSCLRLGLATLCKMIGTVITWSHLPVKQSRDLFDLAVRAVALLTR